VFDRIAKEFCERVKIVTQGDVPNSLVIHSPCFVLFKVPWIDQAHRLFSKKLLRPSETSSDPAAGRSLKNSRTREYQAAKSSGPR
jgi:hypothetical protein